MSHPPLAFGTKYLSPPPRYRHCREVVLLGYLAGTLHINGHFCCTRVSKRPFHVQSQLQMCKNPNRSAVPKILRAPSVTPTMMPHFYSNFLPCSDAPAFRSCLLNTLRCRLNTCISILVRIYGNFRFFTWCHWSKKYGIVGYMVRHCLCCAAGAFAGDPLLRSVGYLEHGSVSGWNGHWPLPYPTARCQGTGADFWFPCGRGSSLLCVLPKASDPWGTRHL